MEQQPDDCAPYALVVEDEPLIRMYVCSILEGAGYRTIEAANAFEALGVLQVHERVIRLLFTDVQMPGADNGLMLAHRCSIQCPHIDILITSGQVTPGPKELPPRASFVCKPFDEGDVLQALSELAISKESADNGDAETRQQSL